MLRPVIVECYKVNRALVKGAKNVALGYNKLVFKILKQGKTRQSNKNPIFCND